MDPYMVIGGDYLYHIPGVESVNLHGNKKHQTLSDGGLTNFTYWTIKHRIYSSRPGLKMAADLGPPVSDSRDNRQEFSYSSYHDMYKNIILGVDVIDKINEIDPWMSKCSWSVHQNWSLNVEVFMICASELILECRSVHDLYIRILMNRHLIMIINACLGWVKYYIMSITSGRARPKYLSTHLASLPPWMLPHLLTQSSLPLIDHYTFWYQLKPKIEFPKLPM